MPNELTSPFENDMFALVAMAFRNLYPGKRYRAKWATEVNDPDDERPMGGMTFFPDDGEIPYIEIACNQYMLDAVSCFAHELAHVAVGHEAERGPEWENAFDAIETEYNRLCREMFGEPGEEDSDAEIH